jgi:uncharacterized protein involved in exopolysaccharide biosynthesis/Mrp family chromosome partitioning ATPase
MKNSITPLSAWQQVPRALPPAATQPPPGWSRNDILFALFRHKTSIGLFGLLGILAGVTVHFFYPRHYESEAKLLVRYVLDRRTLDPIDNTTSTTLGGTPDSVINSEVEILTSWDLAVQVAEAVGPKRLLPSESAPSKEAAAGIVSLGLKVTARPGSNIIYVAYQDRNPELSVIVLNELLSRYFVKHLEVHRSAGAFDFVSQQTDQVKARLNQAEDALKDVKAKLGIVSLADGTATLNAELMRTEEQLHLTEADLAEQRARVKEMHLPGAGADSDRKENAKASSDAVASTKLAATVAQLEPSDNVVEQYRVVINRLANLRKSELDLLSKYTSGSVMVQVARTQISDLEGERKAMEKSYPDISSRVPGAMSAGESTETVTQSARLAGIEAKADTLKSHVEELREKVKQLAELAPYIGDLERKKELEENNYKYFANTLEKARVDEALDPSKIPNISAVQKPSPPSVVTGKRVKIALGFAAGGLTFGIALALLRELFLNQTLKRPVEIEAELHTPLLLAIPDAATNGHPTLPDGRSSDSSNLVLRARRGNLAPWEAGHFIRGYCEAIRDRIGLYFELHQLTHKPKLVGVTSFSQGAGTSTLAAGLAAALSETDQGKVLLVDVNLGPDHVHPFFKGKPAYSLATALQPPTPLDAASENLFLATVGNSHGGPAQLGLKKFFDLMPNLKASDFDYIIFDMPPLVSISPTWGMAAFMDKLLLVVEAEKSNREVVKRGYANLMAERNNVSVVLNKTHSYIPKALDTEN